MLFGWYAAVCSSSSDLAVVIWSYVYEIVWITLLLLNLISCLNGFPCFNHFADVHVENNWRVTAGYLIPLLTCIGSDILPTFSLLYCCFSL
jgi:hypothetical protein